MKIAIDARVINSTTGRYVERLLNYLERMDDKNDYVILVPKKDLDFYKPKNKRFKIVEADFDNYSFSEQIGLLKLLNSLKADLVHFCMPQQPVLYRGKHITTVHDLTLFRTYNSDKNFIVFKIKQLIGRFVFYIVGHNSEHILTPSKYTRDEFVKFAHINKNKVTVTYEGSDVSKTKAEAYSPLENKEFLLYVGQQSDYKNTRRLIEAHQILRKNHPELILALVGKLSGKNGKQLVKNREWVKSKGFEGVVFTDFVPDEQLFWLYKHCATFIFPSLMEGFGLPGIEAMASGAPLASSNATCFPEVYGDGALYFDPLDVKDMANTIDKILLDPSLRENLIKRGLAVSKKYSWEKMAKQTFDVYNKILNR